VIRSFGDPATEQIFHDEDTKRARTIPKALWPIVRRKLSYVHAAATLADLRVPPGNRLEALKGSLADRHSIRVNDQYRITFRFEAGHAWEVCCEDYHS
jgi:proteic killer suppression protein